MTDLDTFVKPQRKGPWLQLRTQKGWEWNRLILPIRNLPSGLDGFRLVHLSDFHFRKKWSEPCDELLETIRQARADLVLITGDFVEDKKDHRPALPCVRRLIEGLESRLGTYAIVGNHDGPLLTGRIRDQKITILDQERLELETGNGVIELIGLPGIEREELDLDYVRNLPPRSDGAPRVVLSHYPDTIRRVPSIDADLFLAGHTHGGQICLPDGSAILSHDSLPRKYAKGVHRWGDAWFIINKGFGFSGLNLRLFCPAEAIEITLVRES
jgi:predicted MPP superfamily phosphohydrolase